MALIRRNGQLAAKFHLSRLLKIFPKSRVLNHHSLILYWGQATRFLRTGNASKTQEHHDKWPGRLPISIQAETRSGICATAAVAMLSVPAAIRSWNDNVESISIILAVCGFSNHSLDGRGSHSAVRRPKIEPLKMHAPPSTEESTTNRRCCLAGGNQEGSKTERNTFDIERSNLPELHSASLEDIPCLHGIVL